MYEINDQWTVLMMKQDGDKGENVTKKEATTSTTKAPKKKDADEKVKESRLFWMKSGLIVKAVGQGFCLLWFVSRKFW